MITSFSYPRAEASYGSPRRSGIPTAWPVTSGLQKERPLKGPIRRPSWVVCLNPNLVGVHHPRRLQLFEEVSLCASQGFWIGKRKPAAEILVWRAHGVCSLAKELDAHEAGRPRGLRSGASLTVPPSVVM